MREKTYLILFLLIAGLLLYLGHDLIRGSVLVAWGLTFSGTATVAGLAIALYRFRMELAASRHELALKEAELSFALQVQQALFPRQLPRTYGLEFSAVCIPARGISGDYYDVLPLTDGRLAFAIADISGKGISAAILMANLQAFLRAVTPVTQLPNEVCARLNEHLHQVTDESKYATFFYAEWSRGEKRLRYVNAGHNPPFLFNADGRQNLDHGGLPLGVMPGTVYETGDVLMGAGDLLVLYSDGITEAGLSAGEEYGVARLGALLASVKDRPLQEIQSSVLRAVRAWSGKDPEDDMTLVIVRAEGR
ncbi:MAG TPA: PP2C family protein-serine/threonine phosphatase [Acidobacteriota bacterium]|nr:PP2C family protein-serine/threonine phosphatase [Acidobacteriota bacterium]